MGRPLKLESDINYVNFSRFNTYSSFSNHYIDGAVSDDSLPAEYSTDEEDEEEPDSDMFKDMRYQSGLWGIHRFDKTPWLKEERPFRRAQHYKKLKLTPEEKDGVLTSRIIACGLSYLERSPYDEKYALCKCQLLEKGLTDISALRPYHYLQYLDLSHNNITKLEALSEMPFLQYLDVSHNYIEIAFDFAPPLYLTYVNYANNKIIRMPYLGEFWSITYLNMSHNCIREIKGLESSKYLRELDLSYNLIQLLQNLNNLIISKLNISHNNLSMVENEGGDCGLKTLRDLDTIDLSYNDLTSLNFLLYNERLKHIDISNNQITDLLEIYYLRFMQDLKTLNLENNKLCENNHFKTMCLRILRNLTNLNGKTVIAEERVMALDVDPQSQAHENKMQLLLLEYLNRPKIGAHLCPYGDPAPSIIVICGPPASGKKVLAKKFIAHSEFLQLGITYTTRVKRKNEVDGQEYYFISHDKFIEMIRKAEFLTVTEFNGHLYGIALSELEKANNSILVFCSDLETGLILKMCGLNPKLILTLPRDEKVHINWIKETYFFENPCKSWTDYQEIKITPVPTVIKLTDEIETTIAHLPFFTEPDDNQSEDTESEEVEEETMAEPKYGPIEDVQSQKIEVDQSSDPWQNNDSNRSSLRRSLKSILRKTKRIVHWKNYNDLWNGTESNNTESRSTKHKQETTIKINKEVSMKPIEEPINIRASYENNKEENVSIVISIAKSDETRENNIDKIDSDIEKEIETVVEKIINTVNEKEIGTVAEKTSDISDKSKKAESEKSVELKVDESLELGESVVSESILTNPLFITVRTSESIKQIEARRATVPSSMTEGLKLKEQEVNDKESENIDLDITYDFKEDIQSNEIKEIDPSESAKKADEDMSDISADSETTYDTPSYVGYNNNQKESTESSTSEEVYKRQSFNNEKLPGDNISFNPSFFEQAQMHFKSISYTHVLQCLQQHLMDNPLLSVLSAVVMQSNDDVASETSQASRKNTLYTTLEERFDALKADKLGPFISRILDTRKEMLELHFANPGLFRTVIFTDDKITDCMNVLKNVMKHSVETRPMSIIKDSWEDTPEFKNFINKKLKDLKVLQNRYTVFW